jgi:hypothetical protein
MSSRKASSEGIFWSSYFEFEQVGHSKMDSAQIQEHPAERNEIEASNLFKEVMVRRYWNARRLDFAKYATFRLRRRISKTVEGVLERQLLPMGWQDIRELLAVRASHIQQESSFDNEPCMLAWGYRYYMRLALKNQGVLPSAQHSLSDARSVLGLPNFCWIRSELKTIIGHYRDVDSNWLRTWQEKHPGGAVPAVDSPDELLDPMLQNRDRF